MRRPSNTVLSTFGGLAVVLLGAVASCRDATSITLDISTDLACDGSATLEVGIAAGKLETVDTRPFVATKTSCEAAGGHVGSLVLVPSGADDEEVAVRVVGAIGRAASSCTATDLKGCIVERRVLRYAPHENQIVPIVLSVACTNVPCGPTQTCRAGVCVGAEPAAVADAAPVPPPVPDATPPPPLCSVPGASSCCNAAVGCSGVACAKAGQCDKCAARCGGDLQHALCCVSATRVDKDGLNKVDCRAPKDGCGP